MFIKKQQVPINKIIAYTNVVCHHKPFKEEMSQVNIKIGVDTLPYDKITMLSVICLVINE